MAVRGKIISMELHKNLNHLLLAGVIGVISIGLSYVQKISDRVMIISEAMIESKATNAVRFSQITEILSDHETRIRDVEKTEQKRSKSWQK